MPVEYNAGRAINFLLHFIPSIPKEIFAGSMEIAFTGGIIAYLQAHNEKIKHAARLLIGHAIAAFSANQSEQSR